jgi:hypothetical protein
VLDSRAHAYANYLTLKPYLVSLHLHNPWLLIKLCKSCEYFCTHVALLTKLQVSWRLCLATSILPTPVRARSRLMRP